jgi:predicted nucleotidyltransferase
MLKLELPLDPGLVRVIAAVQSGAEAEGVDIFLVGAAARDLLLVHVHGQRVRRATKDLDFAVALASWKAFEQLKARLIREYGFAYDTRQIQRLVFTSEGEGEEYAIIANPCARASKLRGISSGGVAR